MTIRTVDSEVFNRLWGQAPKYHYQAVNNAVSVSPLEIVTPSQADKRILVASLWIGTKGTSGTTAFNLSLQTGSVSPEPTGITATWTGPDEYQLHLACCPLERNRRNGYSLPSGVFITATAGEGLYLAAAGNNWSGTINLTYFEV